MYARKEVITPLLVNTAALEHVILCDSDSRPTACFCSFQLQPHSGDDNKQNATRQKTVERIWQRKIFELMLQRKHETGKRIIMLLDLFSAFTGSLIPFCSSTMYEQPIKAGNLSANNR